MSDLRSIFVSYKAIDEPEITIPKFDILAAPVAMIEQGNDMASKVGRVKSKMEQSPIFSGWGTSGIETKKDNSYTTPLTEPTLLLEQSPAEQPRQEPPLTLGETIRLAGYDVPKAWVEMKWKQEIGSPLGQIDERHRKGIVVRDNKGKADNKAGAKTYGPGLLYHPETGRLMQDSEPAGGYSVLELTRLFYKHLEDHLAKGRSIGCKTWNQAAAYGGVIGNFGEHAAASKKLRSLIQSGASDDLIFNHIAHASDRLRHLFPGLITRRMWEARTWVGDFDPGGHQSAANKAKVKQLNAAKFGGILERVKNLNNEKIDKEEQFRWYC